MLEEFEDTKDVIRIHQSKRKNKKRPEDKGQTSIYKNRHLTQLFLYLMHDNMK